jgi:chromate transporter
MAVVLVLGLQFAILSLLAFGGINAILPELQRVVVDTHHWMPAATFLQLFAIGQAAPGPNILIGTLIGWQVAGLGGALVATLALCVPSGLLVFLLERVWSRLRDSRLRAAVESAIAPLSIGLVLASGYLMGRSAGSGWRPAALSAITVLLVLLSRRNPLWLLGAGALLGFLGLV